MIWNKMGPSTAEALEQGAEALREMIMVMIMAIAHLKLMAVAVAVALVLQIIGVLLIMKTMKMKNDLLLEAVNHLKKSK